MLFPIDVIDDESDVTGRSTVLLQTECIVHVKKYDQFPEHSIITYKEDKRNRETYEVPMTVIEVWKHIQKNGVQNLLN